MDEVSRSRQFKNWQWRMGTEPRRDDPTTWEVPFREQVIMDQSLDSRSQYEWFAVAKPSPPTP